MSLKYLWDLILSGYVNRERVREVVRIIMVKNRIRTYLYRDEGYHIAATEEMDDIQGIPKDKSSLTIDMQVVCHNLGKR